MHLKPSEIYYSQDSINNVFDKRCSHSYKLIGETLDEICEGRCPISKIPTISVVQQDGKWVTADNRRLWVFRQLERLRKCDQIHVQQSLYIPSGKMTSENGGSSVRVRGSPGGYWHAKPNVKKTPARNANIPSMYTYRDRNYPNRREDNIADIKYPNRREDNRAEINYPNRCEDNSEDRNYPNRREDNRAAFRQFGIVDSPSVPVVRDSPHKPADYQGYVVRPTPAPSYNANRKYEYNIGGAGVGTRPQPNYATSSSHGSSDEERATFRPDNECTCCIII